MMQEISLQSYLSHFHQLDEFLGDSILLDRAGVDRKPLLDTVTFMEEFRDVTFFPKC